MHRAIVSYASGMANIVLFHSVLGIRQGVLDAATQLQAMGHAVTVPNLYEDGVVFDDYEKASKYVESIGGYPTLLDRTREAARHLPAEVVYAGFSNGGGSAEYLAATRPGALAAVLFAAAIPLAMFAPFHATPIEGWPPGVPVQVHYAVGDPYRDQGGIDGLERDVLAAKAAFELHEYPGSGHLFTDDTLTAEYDAASTALLWERVEAFLAALPA
jgi:dienelactone hydrolase